MKVEGTIIKIGEIKEFDSGFKFLNFVVKTDDLYPQTIEFQIVNDKADNLLKFNKVGDNVEVSLNIRGREWTNPESGEIKYFNTLEAWKVWTKKEETTAAATNEQNDDLPF